MIIENNCVEAKNIMENAMQTIMWQVSTGEIKWN
tara:strand:- start:156 stop:257 length:102 start_codon:yes stop_codon:yes gene_type:complete